jgi:hypothetical protein
MLKHPTIQSNLRLSFKKRKFYRGEVYLQWKGYNTEMTFEKEDL